MMSRDKPRIAVAAGDPAGIGSEISIKAALDARVRDACDPVMVGDAGVIERHARACGMNIELRTIRRVADAVWARAAINVLDCGQPDLASLPFGTTSAASGRASLAFAAAAIKCALAGSVDAVVAAPQNETSIALAGIPFDGYPSFLARETGTDPNDVYLMLCLGGMRITHATLHQSVRQAIAMLTPDKVLGTIRATDRALRKLGIEAPRNVEGPFAADTMFHLRGFDAFVVMLHDHGHIAAKLLAPNATAALTIGTPILFSSVAHGSGHHIAGKGRADPAAMIAALLLLAKTPRQIELQATPA